MWRFHLRSDKPCRASLRPDTLASVEPPNAPRLPIVGNVLSFMRDPLGFLEKTRDSYGDVVRVALGPWRVILVSDPDLVEDVLVTRHKLWRKDRYLRETLEPILGDGLLSSEGDFWRRQRRLAQPAFHRDRIAAYAAAMVDRASVLAEKWRAGGTRDLHADMMGLTLEIVSQTLFGSDVAEHTREVGEALEDLLEYVSDPSGLVLPWLRKLPLPKRRRFDRATARLDAVIYELIARRRNKTGGDDLLGMLLEARDEDGSGMSNEQLRNECMTLFLAGHETTAINLTWTWLLISQHPEIEERMMTEIREVLGDRPATFDDVRKLRLTHQVISESLRLYPPAWSMGREAREDLKLGGFDIPAGHQVWFCPWAIQRDPRWFERPAEFRPERWAEGAPPPRKYAYFPFGGGARICIGQAFAQMEAVLVLATLMQRARVMVTKPPRAQPSVTLRPTGMEVSVSDRACTP